MFNPPVYLYRHLSSITSHLCQSSTRSQRGMCVKFLYSVISPAMLCLSSVTHNAPLSHHTINIDILSLATNEMNVHPLFFFTALHVALSAFLLEWGPYVYRRGPRCSSASPWAVDLNPNTILQILLPLYHTVSLCRASVQAGWWNGVCHHTTLT